MLPLLDAIEFLDPPAALGPVRLDRFSPYHDDPARYGIAGVRPQAPYRFLYPDDERLSRIAYYFDFDYADGRVPLAYARPLLARIQSWIDNGPSGGVWILKSADDRATIVREERGGRRSVATLEGWQARIYLESDRVQGRSRLEEIAAAGRATAQLDDFLQRCVSERLMVRVGERYLALGVNRPSLPVAPFGRPPTRMEGSGRTELTMVGAT
jgi:hypothetical protein